MKTFDGKLALITGGSSGIGLAIATQLAARGANIAILARRPDQLQSAQKAIRSACQRADQKVITLVGDVAQDESIHQILVDFIQSNRTPDYLFNSAGVVHPGNVEELEINRFRWMMEINYFGTVNATKTILPFMLQRGSGHIVNISSMAGILAIYGYTAYSASKFAVRGFTDALRSEMKPRGIDVSIVYPGDTDTPQLSYELQYKSGITKALSENAGKPLPAEKVAADILRGVARGKYAITPGFEPTMIYHLAHTLHRWVPGIVDWMIADAIKKDQRKTQARPGSPN